MMRKFCACDCLPASRIFGSCRCSTETREIWPSYLAYAQPISDAETTPSSAVKDAAVTTARRSTGRRRHQPRIPLPSTTGSSLSLRYRPCPDGGAGNPDRGVLERGGGVPYAEAVIRRG